MPDANPPEQHEPLDAVYKSSIEDQAGLESFGDEVETRAPTPPPPDPRPQASPRPPTLAPITVRQPRRSFSLFLPLMLICVGVVLLLSNLGVLPDISWGVVWRLWPLILIGMGIDALIGRRSRLGSVIGTLLILALLAGGTTLFFVLFGAQVPLWFESFEPVGWETERVEYPLGDVREAKVVIDWTSVPGRLRALEDSSNLVEGDLTYRGRLIFDVQEGTRDGRAASVRLDQDSSGAWSGSFDGGPLEKRWDVRLSPRVPIELVLDGGSGSGDYDLTGLQIEDLALDVGSGAIDLVLPATGGYRVRVDGGSGSLRIVLPPSVSARVELESGSGSFRPDERFRLVRGERGEDGVWETANYSRADGAVLLQIDQKSGSVRIR